MVVMHISTVTKNAPGMRMIHQDLVIKAFSDRDSILPQEITSSGRPIPMKLRVDSAMIAERMFITTMNIMEDTKFGTKCLSKIWKNPPPMHFEATTYSALRICRTSVRTIFAMEHQLVTPMTTAMDTALGLPRIA